MTMKVTPPAALRPMQHPFHDRENNESSGRERIMAKFGVGQPVRRVEDPRLLTGRGKFNDDYATADAAIGYVLRSPHAHAEIRAIDIRRAAAMPGVLAVLTGADLAADGIGKFPGPPPFFAALTRPDGSPLEYPPQYALTSDRARYVGDPIAFIVAETR